VCLLCALTGISGVRVRILQDDETDLAKFGYLPPLMEIVQTPTRLY
jgi:hypothetical protein